MSGADLAAYNRSVGVILKPPRGDDGADARAERLLDQRDQEHERDYGHLPGALQCSLPGRESYREAARAAVAGPVQGSAIPDGVSTAEAQGIIDRLAPWWYRPDPHGDPAVERARREMAAKMAALQVNEG